MLQPSAEKKHIHEATDKKLTFSLTLTVKVNTLSNGKHIMQDAICWKSTDRI